MKNKVLAFDFGASSGRAILATYEDGKLTLEEMHRFSNDPGMVHGTFYWDVLRLFHEIKQGILKCVNSGNGDITSIGIDTWGVDFGLLDKDGKLLENPVHYRDERTKGIMQKVFEVIPQNELYDKTVPGHQHALSSLFAQTEPSRRARKSGDASVHARPFRVSADRRKER